MARRRAPRGTYGPRASGDGETRRAVAILRYYAAQTMEPDGETYPEQVARGAFLSAGQKCTATSRVIVERPAVLALSELLVERARSWKVGDPLAKDTVLGPLVSDERLRTVVGFVEAARADGGQLAAGGGRVHDLGEGHYVRPTVLTGVPASSRASREEIFGPVALVTPAGSYAEARALANDTPFGLSASLFTRPRQGAGLRARGASRCGEGESGDGRARAAGAVRRHEGELQRLARAGQGGTGVLHGVEDRLPSVRPRSGRAAAPR